MRLRSASAARRSADMKLNGRDGALGRDWRAFCSSFLNRRCDRSKYFLISPAGIDEILFSLIEAVDDDDPVEPPVAPSPPPPPPPARRSSASSLALLFCVFCHISIRAGIRDWCISLLARRWIAARRFTSAAPRSWRSAALRAAAARNARACRCFFRLASALRLASAAAFASARCCLRRWSSRSRRSSPGNGCSVSVRRCLRAVASWMRLASALSRMAW